MEASEEVFVEMSSHVSAFFLIGTKTTIMPIIMPQNATKTPYIVLPILIEPMLALPKQCLEPRLSKRGRPKSLKAAVLLAVVGYEEKDASQTLMLRK